MVLKLYGYPKSTPARLVALICKEKEIPFEVVVVNHMNGENKAPEYTKFQPFGQTPYIDDDGFILYESRAIVRYLIKKYPNQGTAGLIPTDPKEEALFEQAYLSEIFQFNAHASPLVVEKVIKKLRKLQPDPDKVREHRCKLEATLDVYEEILSRQKYLVGNTVTLADLQHLPYGNMLLVADLGDEFEKRPNVARWWKDISTRPSWEEVKNWV